MADTIKETSMTRMSAKKQEIIPIIKESHHDYSEDKLEKHIVPENTPD